MTALLCGNRFGRRLVRPGGLGVVPGAEALAELGARLEQAMAGTFCIYIFHLG
jgi:hypothetical protein